jgi:pimeloyl-ACP methyl ester carboxylesterase
MKVFRVFLWSGCVIVALAVVGAVAFWLRPIELAHGLLYMRLSFSGAESRSIMVAGCRIHYDAVGPASGQPVVLVHGLGGSAEDWVNLAPYLARAGFRVYMPDLPGYGRSQQPADFSYSVPDEAGAVVGFLDALGLKQVDLGGWSMGGWIAQWVAVQHPDRVSRLMLFDSAGIYAKPEWNTGLFTPASAAELDQLDALLMPHPPQVPGFIAADFLRVSRKNAWVIHRALASMLTGREATDKLLPTLKMPVLIVWGELDRITPLAQANTIHRLVPQSLLDVVPGCGHLAPGQCAEQIGPRVVDFLEP